ncbi:hypothetical protein [Flammeovirga agarivorans]|uniref:Uncharacterized protein n=1 Tax=Flammeovirga agarivorans TaxID=2726742 RepID=A0A7X8SKH7_9BACT|nr:hypothetical protein [Flammeovirga agarivorans]NLR91793.1 hypothetical protein [Flammeovirga agarivorans]
MKSLLFFFFIVLSVLSHYPFLSDKWEEIELFQEETEQLEKTVREKNFRLPVEGPLIFRK